MIGLLVNKRMKIVELAWLCVVIAWTKPSTGKSLSDTYEIGTGIADVTGPAADVEMMGYGKTQQTTAGIHLRQYSRAYIFGDGDKRIVFVSVDAGQISQVVRQEVLQNLESLFNGTYTEDNVCLSSTHTHSGPAGFFGYFIYQVMSFGFIKETFNALVNGIVASIVKAHNSVKQGHIYFNEGELHNASINRSPASYLQNPADERARYKDDTDKNMFLLKLVDTAGTNIGMINWFAVHGTSMNYTNQLISSDNKGYASILFENYLDPGSLPGEGRFVCAFAQSNEGDVSPNTAGPRCLDTGLPCDFDTSACPNQAQCVAFGPGKDMFDSTRIIGQMQFDKAQELFNSAQTKLNGSIKFIRTSVDMSNVTVRLNASVNVTTCKPALGHGFPAGTTDGPGVFDFKQHTTYGNENAVWKAIRDAVSKPSPEQEKCHYPKSILINTGHMNSPYPWQQTIVELQLLQIGKLVIIAVPGEFTTMSGRRLREAVKKVMNDNGEDVIVVIAGLSNGFTQYITTYEEYQFQRYEGASTLFGPYTLSAYIQLFTDLTTRLTQNLDPPAGPSAPTLLDRQITLLLPVLFDTAPLWKQFGSILEDTQKNYHLGSQVKTVFVCGNPRNNIKFQSFLSVQRAEPNSKNWTIVATDANWETRFMWKRTNALLRQSACTITWDIPTTATSAVYRITHSGFSKSFLGVITEYNGMSSNFTVTS